MFMRRLALVLACAALQATGRRLQAVLRESIEPALNSSKAIASLLASLRSSAPPTQRSIAFTPEREFNLPKGGLDAVGHPEWRLRHARMRKVRGRMDPWFRKTTTASSVKTSFPSLPATLDTFDLISTLPLGISAPTHASFNAVPELNHYLQIHGVDTTIWGRGKTKTVQDLLDEIHAKEATLSFYKGKLHRRLRVAKLLIRIPEHPRHHLFCVAQQFPDGRVRYRSILPSEKMFAGEEVIDAAARAMQEELNVGRYLFDIDPSTHHVWSEIAESTSYPTLMTFYELHQVKVLVYGGAPRQNAPAAGQFYTEEDGGQVHIWDWCQDNGEDTPCFVDLGTSSEVINLAQCEEEKKDS